MLTPPKWVDFNVAARENERQGKDRSLLTYVRGAWAQQSGEGREVVSQVLRPDTTWTAIAETYANGEGRVVVLAQVLFTVEHSLLVAIAEHGADVSTEQIAAQAGVARTRLYRHFAGAIGSSVRLQPTRFTSVGPVLRSSTQSENADGWS